MAQREARELRQGQGRGVLRHPATRVAGVLLAALMLAACRSGPLGPLPGKRLEGADNACSADFVMIPKLRHAAELRLLDKVLPPSAGFLFPLIESPDALEGAYEIAAHPRAECVLFGAVDFAAEAGCETTWEALLYARSRLACACAANGATLFDVPYLALDDAQGCEAETRRSRALGIRARCAIHPRQIEPIHRALAPSAGEVAHARRVVAAYQSGGLGQLDGALVELPVFKRAQQVLAAAGEPGGS